MRTFGTIMALLLIFFGLVVAGLVVVRIWQDNGVVQVDVTTTDGGGAEADAVLVAANAPAAEAGPPEAEDVQLQRLVVGVESGGMAFSAPTEESLLADASTPLDAPLPPVDPCAPAPVQGFPADTAVVAVGTLRVYSQTDVTSPALRDLSAGQGLWIVAGEDGSTAVKRCELTWQRVRTADGIVGWVLEDAIDIVAPEVVTPTVPVVPAVPIVPASPCVSGCNQPGCVQPCPTPCSQPCMAPCTTPCGVYSK